MKEAHYSEGREFCNWDQMGSSSVQIVLGLPNFIWWKRLMVTDGHMVTLGGCICFQNEIHTLSKYDRFCAEGGLIQIFQQNIFEKRISPWSYMFRTEDAGLFLRSS